MNIKSCHFISLLFGGNGNKKNFSFRLFLHAWVQDVKPGTPTAVIDIWQVYKPIVLIVDGGIKFISVIVRISVFLII